MVPSLKSEAVSQVGQLQSLIDRAESMRKISSHPGKTEEFIQWRSELETFISRNCGRNSHEYFRYASLLFFPKWFDSKRHGALSKDVQGIVTTNADDSDRQRALDLYKDALIESIALLKSLIIEVNNTGWALKPTDSPDSSNGPVFQTSFSQLQQQQQDQSQTQLITLEQKIEQALRIIEEHYGEEQSKKAREVLGELKKDSKWSTVQKIASWFLILGRDAFIAVLPTLAQVLSK